jgi:hypothetical protein
MGMRREGVGLLDLSYFYRGKIVETIKKNPVGGFFSSGRWR